MYNKRDMQERARIVARRRKSLPIGRNKAIFCWRVVKGKLLPEQVLVPVRERYLTPRCRLSVQYLRMRKYF